MNASQAITGVLAKMKLGGLPMSYGSAPSSPDEVKLQVEAYLSAIRGVSKREINPAWIVETGERFLTGRAGELKFPNAPEFAAVYSEVANSHFVMLGVPVGENTVEIIEVPREMPPEKMRELIDAKTPKSLPRESTKTRDERSKAHKRLLAKATREPIEVDPEFEANRKRAIDLLKSECSDEPEAATG